MTALAVLGFLAVVAWVVLWIGFGVVGGAVHLLLIIGAILLIWAVVLRANGRAGTGL